MTLQKRDEITEKCTVYLSSKAWQKHFMNKGVLSFSIEIHEGYVQVSGLDNAGRNTASILLIDHDVVIKKLNSIYIPKFLTRV